MGCSPPDSSSAHGILQVGILEQVDMSSSKGSSPPRDQTGVSTSPVLASRLFTINAIWEALIFVISDKKTETNPLSTCFIAAHVQFKKEGRKDKR